LGSHPFTAPLRRNVTARLSVSATSPATKTDVKVDTHCHHILPCQTAGHTLVGRRNQDNELGRKSELTSSIRLATTCPGITRGTPPRTRLHSLDIASRDFYGLQAPFPASILLGHRTLRPRSRLRTYQLISIMPESQVLQPNSCNYIHTDCYLSTTISGESMEFVPRFPAHQCSQHLRAF
jgi:hypothetical protein